MNERDQNSEDKFHMGQNNDVNRTVGDESAYIIDEFTIQRKTEDGRGVDISVTGVPPHEHRFTGPELLEVLTRLAENLRNQDNRPLIDADLYPPENPFPDELINDETGESFDPNDDLSIDSADGRRLIRAHAITEKRSYSVDSDLRAAIVEDVVQDLEGGDLEPMRNENPEHGGGSDYDSKREMMNRAREIVDSDNSGDWFHFQEQYEDGEISGVIRSPSSITPEEYRDVFVELSETTTMEGNGSFERTVEVGDEIPINVIIESSCDFSTEEYHSAFSDMAQHQQ